MLKIQQIPMGTMSVNCYLLYNENNEALVIDPASNPELLMEIINRNDLSIKAVVLTHGHFDHIESTDLIINTYNCDLIIHIEDSDMIIDPQKNVSSLIGKNIVVATHPSRVVQDNDIIELGEDQIRIIHTPGHTPGGICLLCNSFILVGDTLFKGSYGRTDFPRGNQMRLFNSIKKRLLTLDESLVVYTGHGDPTTIGEEKRHW